MAGLMQAMSSKDVRRNNNDNNTKWKKQLQQWMKLKLNYDTIWQKKEKQLQRHKTSQPKTKTKS